MGYTLPLHTSQTALLLILTYLTQKIYNLLEVGADVGLTVRATVAVITGDTSVTAIPQRAFPSFFMVSFLMRPKVVSIIAIKHNARKIANEVERMLDCVNKHEEFLSAGLKP